MTGTIFRGVVVHVVPTVKPDLKRCFHTGQYFFNWLTIREMWIIGLMLFLWSWSQTCSLIWRQREPKQTWLLGWVGPENRSVAPVCRREAAVAAKLPSVPWVSIRLVSEGTFWCQFILLRFHLLCLITIRLHPIGHSARTCACDSSAKSLPRSWRVL